MPEKSEDEKGAQKSCRIVQKFAFVGFFFWAANLTLIFARLTFSPLSQLTFRIARTNIMASADVLHASLSTPTFTPLDAELSIKRKRVLESDIPSSFLELMEDTPTRVQFDPAKHLNFEHPSKVYTMEEIGFSDQGISPVAVSEPFPLFTEEAIKQMRAEVLSKPVLENCKYSSNLAHSQLRGMAPG